MPLTIADYISQVRYLIRDTAGLGTTPNPSLFIFADGEISDYIQDGLTEYTRYRKRRRPITVSFQDGVSQYTMPSDWITVDAPTFEKAIEAPDQIDFEAYAGFVLPSLTPGFPIWDLNYEWYDSDQSLIVSPAPGGAYTLDFSYFAMHTIDASESTVPQQDARFVSLAAASFALNALAVDRGLRMQKYKMGQRLTVDDTEVTKALQARADRYMDEFNKRVVMTAIGVSG